MKKIKIKLEVQYDGHSIKKNGSVDLRFKSPYSELVKSLELLQLINCNINIKAKVNNVNYEIGTFYLNNLSVDRDGESKIKFNTELENVEMNNLNNLTERDVIIFILCSGGVEEEE